MLNVLFKYEVYNVIIFGLIASQIHHSETNFKMNLYSILYNYKPSFDENDQLYINTNFTNGTVVLNEVLCDMVMLFAVIDIIT